MKKVVLFFAVATAVALASCGGQSQPSESTQADSIEVVEEVVAVIADSAAADTAIAVVAVDSTVAE